MAGTYDFWDLGEADLIRPSGRAMGKIMQALVQCRGRLHSSYSAELDPEGNWRYAPSSRAVVLRISLPIGRSQMFMDLTGYTLTSPPKVSLYE